MVTLKNVMVINGSDAMTALLRKSGISDYTKIRSYVISQIARSGDTPMRLASVREIARQFGVSHPTVVKALKDLIADGFLYAKPGRSGTFTCPEKLNANKDKKVIGILSSDGKEVFINRYNNNIAFALADSLQAVSRNNLIRNVSLTHSRPLAAKEILSLGLNALLWIAPGDKMLPAVKELAERDYLLLVGGAKLPGVNCLYGGVESEYRKATGVLLDEGRRRVALVVGKGEEYPHRDAVEKGWRAAYRERGIPCDDSLLLTQSRELARDFEEALDATRPDGVCFSDMEERYYDALKRKYDLASQCRVYTVASAITRNMGGYLGYAGYPMFRQAAAKAAAEFSALLAGGRKNGSPIHIEMDIEIRLENQAEASSR